jgi:membrane protein involved in colicin uptake
VTPIRQRELDVTHDIWDRIRYARDAALDAEKTERRRLADAGNADLQQAASVRLATRQAVREALDDILDESSDPERAAS